MQDLHPQVSGFHTLHQEIDSRIDHRFSEAEVKDFLQHVAPQIQWLHNQGKCHSAISLDAFAFQDDQVCLLENTTAPQLLNGQRQDIFNLGTVALQMLTGKPVETLRDSYGNWNWEDDCFVSDQLAALLNRMIGQSSHPPIATIHEVIQNLQTPAITQPEPSLIVVPPPPPEHLARQVKQPSTEPTIAATPSPQAASKLKLWHWLVLGMICGGGVAAFWVPSFLREAREAKETAAVNYLAVLERSQQAYWGENESFANSIDALGLTATQAFQVRDVPITEIYRFSVTPLSEVSAVVTAHARDKGLKSFSTITFLSQGQDEAVTSEAVTCQTLEPSRSAPQWPELMKNAVVCPPGSEILGAGFTGGTILLEPIPEEPELPPPPVRLTPESALGILSRWQRAKQAAYSPPYDMTPMREVLAGVMLNGNSGNGGRLRSAQNLRASGSYYRYNQRGVTPVPGTFYSDEARAEITVDVDERGDLYNSAGRRSSQGSFDSTYRVTYYFQKMPDSSGENRWFIVRCAGPASCRAD